MQAENETVMLCRAFQQQIFDPVYVGMCGLTYILWINRILHSNITSYYIWQQLQDGCAGNGGNRPLP